MGPAAVRRVSCPTNGSADINVEDQLAPRANGIAPTGHQAAHVTHQRFQVGHLRSGALILYVGKKAFRSEVGVCFDVIDYHGAILEVDRRLVGVAVVLAPRIDVTGNSKQQGNYIPRGVPYSVVKDLRNRPSGELASRVDRGRAGVVTDRSSSTRVLPSFPNTAAFVMIGGRDSSAAAESQRLSVISSVVTLSSGQMRSCHSMAYEMSSYLRWTLAQSSFECSSPSLMSFRRS